MGRAGGGIGKSLRRDHALRHLRRGDGGEGTVVAEERLPSSGSRQFEPDNAKRPEVADFIVWLKQVMADTAASSDLDVADTSRRPRFTASQSGKFFRMYWIKAFTAGARSLRRNAAATSEGIVFPEIGR
jgi:hypothetical protein